MVDNPKEKKSKTTKILLPFKDKNKYEIGVDEVGRGPMIGRVYTAAVILPKDNFKHHLMKDSKRFTSKKKLKEMSDYIKEYAISYSITFEDEKFIDENNIKQATFSSMNSSISECISNCKLNKNIILDENNTLLLIDGNDFIPYMYFQPEKKICVSIPHECIIGGDDTYTSIAAASILAKVARDEYIEDLCNEFNYLDAQYDLLKNKGYGTKKHIQGIKEYGLSPFHRKTFGICKKYIN